MSVEKTEVETFFGRCRCCLAYGYLKDMWSEHKYNGNLEIYGEMLAKCFALTWDHSDDSAEQDQICEDCIVRLRDAHDFKKVVLDSQVELSKMLEDENEATIKEERLDENLLAEHSDDNDDDETMSHTEYITFNVDTMESFKEEAPETEYTDIEYLEDEDGNVTATGDNSLAGDHASDYGGDSVSDSSQTCNPQPVQRKKRPRVLEEDDESGTPKKKWPAKLPKSERHKTYKQYSELDLQKCLEQVRSGDLTPGDAAVMYNIPKKTICAKVKVNSSDVPIDNTTKSKPKMDQRQTRLRKKPTIFKSYALDAKTIKQIENNKLKVKNRPKNVKKEDPINVKSPKKVPKEDLCDKDKNVKEIDAKIEVTIEPKPEQIDAKQVRKRYKAIVNNKFKNQEAEKQDINEINKHKDNLKRILDNSNATCLKGIWKSGYYCNFCNEHTELPSDMKKHNLEAHNSIDEVITVKYVSDLFIRLDISDLKCKICNEKFKKLDDFIEHLTKTHDIKFHTDIKKYIIPFVFDKDTLKCAICDKEFKYFKLLSEHMSDHYRNFECPHCDRAFINRQCMLTHMYRHKKGVFKCSQCPKVFDSRPKRSAHERVVHALLNKTRKCSICSERFATKDLVQAHAAKVHGLELPVFPCPACNKSYNSVSSLLTHRNRFHLMQRPHKCSYCEKAFYSKIELKAHTVTHTKTREFKCDRCTKSFGTRCSLNQHIRGHLNDRRFKCDLCGRSFVHRTAYRGHMRKIHSTIV